MVCIPPVHYDKNGKKYWKIIEVLDPHCYGELIGDGSWGAISGVRLSHSD